MGMAASQARYLSLTARKTNVEYEGQQVNQQRTAIANQSAALYTEMLALDVPTPPSATDYTKTVYTYKDPSALNSKNTLEAIYKNPVGEDGKETYTITGFTSKETITSNKVSLTNTTFKNDGDSTPLIYPDGNAYCYTVCGPLAFDGLIDSFKKANPEGTFNAGDQYYYYKNSQDGTYYYFKAEKNGEDYLTPKQYIDSLSGNKTVENMTVYSAQSTVYDEYFNIGDAVIGIATDGTNRFDTITFKNDKGDVLTCKLTQQTVQDDAAFDAAMETYEAKKSIYDKTVSEINAKTEIIQQQDKSLELHLDQLDTEQQAIQTEMEAIKKVIDKNIEETFKIFA